MGNVFPPEKLNRLNNTQRLRDIPPDIIWNRLRPGQPKTMIDIGAGTGLFAIPFAAKMKGGKLYACDISEAMVDWIKENVCPGHPDITALKMDDCSVPLEDGLADLVFMINLHHELDRPEAMIKEAFRLLKNGGKVFVVDWKKTDMPEGPSLGIRTTPDEVAGQMLGAGFVKPEIYQDLLKHFLVIAEKE